MGRLKPGVTLDQVNAEFIASGQAFGPGIPEDESKFHVRKRAAAVELDDWSAISPNGLGDARRRHSGVADRVRERDEHAIRPRGVARERTGDSRRAGRDSLAAGAANVDRKFRGRGTRSGRGNSPRLLGGRYVHARNERTVESIALLDVNSRSMRAFSHSRSALLWSQRSLRGLLPALISAHGNAAEMMKEGGRGNTSRLANIIMRVLVVGQIALTAALLIAATLQIKSIRNQLKLNYGYDENAVYTARMALMEGAYTEDGRREFFKRAVRELRANPQFEAAALSDRFQMTFAGGGQYEVDGQNYLTDRDRPRGNFESVSDDYFSALGLKILEGRDFTIDDADSKQPVAIVNASFARKHWGNQSALGHQVRIFNPGQPPAVAHHRRRGAGHVDAGTVRPANRQRRVLHAAARRPASDAVLHNHRSAARRTARRNARTSAEQSGRSA